ncbi:MAG: glycosyltransferase, partial [Burkholderiales bacterium]|nr:glycosyltransferase [Anaerolineae bacterium]
MTPQLNLFWEGTQLAYHSFARINRALSLSLIASGVVNMTLVPYEPDEFAAENNRDYEMLRSHDLRTKGFQALSQGDLPGAWVRHVFPPRSNRPPKGIKWAAIQPWEYSVMPTIYADALRHADEVWTPSNFSRAALLRSSVENVHVIPWGVDSAFFSPFGETAPLPTTKRFKFLFVGGTIYRKGIDVLLESFCRAFTAADDVCLVIKDAGGSLYKGQTSAQLVQQWQSQTNTPEIVYLDQSLTDAELGALYRACDVFVSPYRGEGFSLPTLESLACGLPVIVTG